jgi:hypothetical protein
LLENWAQGHNEPTRFSSNNLMLDYHLILNSLNSGYLGVVIGSSNRYDKGWLVCSIKGVFMEGWNSTRFHQKTPSGLREENLRSSQRDIPLLKDVAVAPLNTWWLLVQVEGDQYSSSKWYIWDSKRTKRFYVSPFVMFPQPLQERQPVLDKDGLDGNTPEPHAAAAERRTLVDTIR